MIKRILKTVFKGIIGILLLIAMAYGGFHLWEYATGGKYVDYLKENSETVSLNESFSFNMLDNDIAKNSLIMVGEIHGFEEPQKFDYDLFTHLNANHHVTQYYAELDYVQALVLNEYMESGDEKLLQAALKNWAVVQGRNNKDYNDKFRKFHAYYQDIPEKQKFKFLGVDQLQDVQLTIEYLNSLSDSIKIEHTEKLDLENLFSQLEQLNAIYAESPDTLFHLTQIKNNLNFYSDKTNRENVLFKNFQALYQEKNNKQEKAYAYFGLYHVFQYRVNNNEPLAAQIRMSDLGLTNKILSINFLMVDSYMIMPSNQLPDFMRDKGKFSKMPISSDVMLFMYIYGIKDFKRMTPENHKSLVKMNADNSPYATSNRLNKTIQLLPVADKFEFNEPGKPYVQYTLFVRNSDWAEPEQ